MTDTPTASSLTPFEGRPVRKVGIEMPSAAGGLREALTFAPVELHHGQEGYMVLHWKVNKVRFDPIDAKEVDDSDLRRVHVLGIEQVALVENDEWARQQLAEQAQRIQRAKEAAQGIEPLANDGTSAADWGGTEGPLDEEPIDPEAGKVIEGAFGAPGEAPVDPADPAAPDEAWQQEDPPPAAEDVKPSRKR